MAAAVRAICDVWEDAGPLLHSGMQVDLTPPGTRVSDVCAAVAARLGLENGKIVVPAEVANRDGSEPESTARVLDDALNRDLKDTVAGPMDHLHGTLELVVVPADFRDRLPPADDPNSELYRRARESEEATYQSYVAAGHPERYVARQNGLEAAIVAEARRLRAQDAVAKRRAAQDAKLRAESAEEQLAGCRQAGNPYHTCSDFCKRKLEE
jgi:hypothetical protein